jgi:multicomponent Na+:H+ antiporter subunit G
MIMLGWLLCGLGMMTLLVAALGIIRLPGTLARQHAATKAGTLAVTCFALGLLLTALASGHGSAWTWRLLALMMILFLTLPLASHALARAAVHENPERE